jgi:hypothetical protein
VIVIGEKYKEFHTNRQEGREGLASGFVLRSANSDFSQRTKTAPTHFYHPHLSGKRERSKTFLQMFWTPYKSKSYSLALPIPLCMEWERLINEKNVCKNSKFKYGARGDDAREVRRAKMG